MYFILALMLGMGAHAANSPQNCLRNFLFPLNPGVSSGPGAGPVIVGDSIVEPLSDGSIAVHRPKATATVGADGVRCNGQAGPEQGIWNFLAGALKKRAGQGPFSQGEKNRLRIVAEYCWDLSPKLNDAISEVMRQQHLPPPDAEKGPAATSK